MKNVVGLHLNTGIHGHIGTAGKPTFSFSWRVALPLLRLCEQSIRKADSAADLLQRRLEVLFGPGQRENITMFLGRHKAPVSTHELYLGTTSTSAHGNLSLVQLTLKHLNRNGGSGD